MLKMKVLESKKKQRPKESNTSTQNPAMTEETWKWKGQDLASNAI